MLITFVSCTRKFGTCSDYWLSGVIFQKLILVFFSSFSSVVVYLFIISNINNYIVINDIIYVDEYFNTSHLTN